MIKGSVQQEDITILNIYASNTGASAYVKQILIELKGEIDCNAFILGDFTHHSPQRIDPQGRK